MRVRPFSQGHIYNMSRNLKYWCTAVPSGIFFEIWPHKKDIPSIHTAEGRNKSRVPRARIIYFGDFPIWSALIMLSAVPHKVGAFYTLISDTQG
jgi:hypothetical protein